MKSISKYWVLITLMSEQRKTFQKPQFETRFEMSHVFIFLKNADMKHSE